MFNEIKNKISRDAYKTINRIINYFSLICKVNHLEFLSTKIGISFRMLLFLPVHSVFDQPVNFVNKSLKTFKNEYLDSLKSL